MICRYALLAAFTRFSRCLPKAVAFAPSVKAGTFSSLSWYPQKDERSRAYSRMHQSKKGAPSDPKERCNIAPTLPSNLLLDENETTKSISISVGPNLNAAVATTSSTSSTSTPEYRGELKLPLNPKIVHFNNAGASPSPSKVLETIMVHLTNEATLGAYLAANLRKVDTDQIYQSIATLINADSASEIALVESATVAWTRSFYAAAEYAISKGNGDVMLCCEAEYAANLVAMQKLAMERGARLIAVPSFEDSGIVDIGAFQSMLDDPTIGPKVRLVCMTHIPTNSGIVNPMEQVGEVIDAFNKKKRGNDSSSTTKDKEVIFLVDACQSVGQRVVDVRSMNCHILTATGRKYLRGPRGTGFLYVRNDIVDKLVPTHIDHEAAPVIAVPEKPVAEDVSFRYRDGARRFEFWESSIADRLGLGAAVDHALEIGMDVIERQCSNLGMQLQNQLREIPGVKVHHDHIHHAGGKDGQCTQCGIVTFTVHSHPSQDIVFGMLEEGFAISMSPATSTPLDTSRSKCPDVVRASLTYFNSIDEIDDFCRVLRGLLE